MRRLLFGRATEASLDSNGRILLPEFLREYAHLGSDATLVGGGGYFEIWDAETWAKELESVADPASNAQRFAAFDLSTE